MLFDQRQYRFDLSTIIVRMVILLYDAASYRFKSFKFLFTVMTTEW